MLLEKQIDVDKAEQLIEHSSSRAAVEEVRFASVHSAWMQDGGVVEVDAVLAQDVPAEGDLP